MKLQISQKQLFLALRALLILIIVTVSFAVFGSLFFEYYLKLTPCYLCWWQRILWYPLFIIWIAPFSKTDTKVKYTIVFSVLGQIIALYHSTIQIVNWQGFNLCQPQDFIDCTTIQVKILGLSIPNLSFIGFAIIFVFSILYLKLNKLFNATR